jgi:transposase
MRKAREILRLKYEAGLTNRQIARSIRSSHVTVGQYLERARQAGIGWPLPPDLGEEELSEMLFASQKAPGEARRPLPQMGPLHRELKKDGVTLSLLWEEYRANHPDGYGYTQFCEYYKRWRSRLEPSLRQAYKAGEKLFVDWAGDTIALLDPKTGQERAAYLFVAVLGASNYTYAEAFENQKQPHWIEGHIHAFEFMGGVAEITTPDNEKTGVNKACYYEPDLNPTYQEMAAHYGTVVIPARAGKPKDKAKVESAVLNAERRILAVLRNQRFFSLAELNGAIRKALHALNERPFQKMEGCRREFFEHIERPALRPLPAQRYELSQWRRAKVNIDYHVQVDWHLYSVPHQLIHETVDVRLRLRTVEIFHRGKRVALHQRSGQKGKFTTDRAHRPKAHQRHLEWTPSRLIGWAGRIGEHCAAVAEAIMRSRPHPEQGYRSCLGLMRLSRHYGRERLEAACRRALLSGACNYQSVKSMLQTGLDRQPLPEPEPELISPSHANIRGEHYYQ